MPTYDYVCGACGHEFEHFQSMSEKRLTKCPACGKARLVRKVGAGAGVIFKGTGFYQTDYKAKEKPSAGTDRPPGKDAPAPASSSDAPATGPAPEKSSPAPAAGGNSAAPSGDKGGASRGRKGGGKADSR
jgi:putative FmdB family regulatory protein